MVINIIMNRTDTPCRGARTDMIMNEIRRYIPSDLFNLIIYYCQFLEENHYPQLIYKLIDSPKLSRFGWCSWVYLPYDTIIYIDIGYGLRHYVRVGENSLSLLNEHYGITERGDVCVYLNTESVHPGRYVLNLGTIDRYQLTTQKKCSYIR